MIITVKENLFLIYFALETAISRCYLKKAAPKICFIEQKTIKAKRYMKLCHFFFSSTFIGIFRTLTNIYDGAIQIDG